MMMAINSSKQCCSSKQCRYSWYLPTFRHLKLYVTQCTFAAYSLFFVLPGT
jgi:hypothetical protein